MPKKCQEWSCLLVAAALAVRPCSATAQASTVTAELRRVLEADANDPLPARLPADSAARTRVLIEEWRKRFKPRHDRIVALVNAGALASSDDYFLAANILLHGVAPEDYLAAHLLFLRAARDGHRDALWQSAEALDDYLVAIGRPQLFGMVLGGRRRVFGSDAMDPLRRRYCLPPRARLDQFARVVANRRPGTLDRQPLTNMLFWSESALGESRAFRARSGIVLTPLVIACPAPLPASTADYDVMTATILRRSPSGDDKLIAHALLAAAAISGHRDALEQSDAALDEFLRGIGRGGIAAQLAARGIRLRR